MKIPLWIIAITAFAFLHPILITVAAYGRGIVPGWYLHALAAALAPVIGVALASATKRPWSWLVVIAGITYGAVYLVGATLLQLLFFSGCGRAIEGRFLLSSAPHCWIALPALLRNLSILSNPVSALLLMAIAVVLMGVGLIGVGRLAGAQGSRR